MRKSFWLWVFIVLTFAGVCLSAFFLFCKKDKDGADFILKALGALSGAGFLGAILLLFKKEISTDAHQNPSKVTLVPPRNRDFTGREKLLKDIYNTFNKKKDKASTIAITGFGGKGKTQTALEYVYRYAKKYKCICWVNAENEKTILRFASICLKEENHRKRYQRS